LWSFIWVNVRVTVYGMIVKCMQPET
jgi:hypothetical protein